MAWISGLALLWAAACASAPKQSGRPEGSGYLRQSFHEEARDAFLRASEKDPNAATLQRKVAVLSARLDDVEIALGAALRAVELDWDR